MNVEIETERLRLRQLRESDHEPFARHHADPDMTRFLGGPITPEESWRWLLATIGHWGLRGYGYFAIEERASGEVCGAAGLQRHFDWPEMELGWRLFPPNRGRGYATEAAGAIRQHAYDALKATTLVSYIVPDNIPSIRVAERLGAEHESTIVLRGQPAAVYRHPYPLN